MLDARRTRNVLIQLAAEAIKTYGCEAAADFILEAMPKSSLPDEPPVCPEGKLAWVKWHRARYGSSLKEAKEAADEKWINAGV